MSQFAFSTPAFDDGERIPKRFTCDGADASPPLSFADVPDDTARLAVTVDDLDTPNESLVHWLVWNLPPELDGLPADVSPVRKLDDLGGAYQGTNGFGDVGYRGPCPAEDDGAHTYRFTLHALGVPLDAKGGATRPDLIDELRGARIASAKFTGVCER
jgi:Raf kinase inhibitor-like YbhB/YbcL family protein